MLNREKHTLITLKESDLGAGLNTILRKFDTIEHDLIIDLSAIRQADEDTVEKIMEKLSSLVDEWIVILVGNEDKLQELGFLEDDIPSTPTYNEALDYLYMMQLERELGEDE